MTNSSLPSPKIKKLLTISEAAAVLCVSTQTLRDWDKKNVLRAVRFGTRGDRRYRRDDVERFLAQGSHTDDQELIDYLTATP